MENIDDECDNLGIVFVKIDNADEAKEYGIEKIPALMYFEKGIPTLYKGKFAPFTHIHTHAFGMITYNYLTGHFVVHNITTKSPVCSNFIDSPDRF